MDKLHIVWGSGRGRIRYNATVRIIYRVPDGPAEVADIAQYYWCEWQETYNSHGPFRHLGFIVDRKDLLDRSLG